MTRRLQRADGPAAEPADQISRVIASIRDAPGVRELYLLVLTGPHSRS